MIAEIMSFLLVLSSVMTMLCPRDAECNSSSKRYLAGNDKTDMPIVEGYLNALEKFDMTNASCTALTSAIAKFIKLVNQEDGHRSIDELGAFMYAFPKLRPLAFPDVQATRRYILGGWDERKVMASIHRADGTLFLFCAWQDVVEAMNFVNRKYKNGVKVCKWVTRDVKHIVGVRLWWALTEDEKEIRLSSRYLIDETDYRMAVNVTVFEPYTCTRASGHSDDEE